MGLSILMHGVITLRYATSYDNALFKTHVASFSVCYNGLEGFLTSTEDPDQTDLMVTG